VIVGIGVGSVAYDAVSQLFDEKPPQAKAGPELPEGQPAPDPDKFKPADGLSYPVSPAGR